MGVEHRKSALVTAADAVPASFYDVALSGGRLRVQEATIELAAADDDGSTYRLFRVQSHWHVVSIELFHDSVTSGTDFDLGIYETAANGGAVVDATAYGEALDLSTAANVRVEFDARDKANILNKVWEDAGLTADPGKSYDIALLGVTVGSGAVTISGRLIYTVD